MPAMYLLRTFGGLTLTHATTHQLIGAARRKPLALLAIVAASGERGVERDGIATMLWPELDEMHARRALSQTLYALRRELGDDVLRDSPRLTIDATKLTSDATEFETLARPGGTRRDLERAAALYTGPYLDGVHFVGCTEFEHWAEMARAFHSAAYLGVLREIARLAAVAGDAPRAIDWLERAAREFPLDSDVAAALARAYADSGRHGQAYAFLNAHFAALEAELGTAPPDHLVSLGRELQTGPAEPSVRKAKGGSAVQAARDKARATSPRASAATRLGGQRGIAALAPTSSGLQRIGGIAAALLGTVAALWAFRWKPIDQPESLSAAFVREMPMPGSAGARGPVLARVNIFSIPELAPLPVSTTGLATYTDDVLRPALAKVARLIPIEQMETLHDRVLTPLDRGREPNDLTRRLLEISDAQFALESTIFDVDGRSDSISLGITLYRRTLVPPCPEGWSRFAPKDVADTGSYEGVESWSSFRVRTPRARPTRYVDSLVRSAKRMLESMNSCDLEAHRSVTTSPWCWAGANHVSVVPGVVRARILAGEDITMTMTTSKVPGGRGRYCIYSSAGRMSSS
jgi:DNA-binding SARP family transcriptional activator